MEGFFPVVNNDFTADTATLKMTILAKVYLYPWCFPFSAVVLQSHHQGFQFVDTPTALLTVCACARWGRNHGRES